MRPVEHEINEMSAWRAGTPEAFKEKTAALAAFQKAKIAPQLQGAITTTDTAGTDMDTIWTTYSTAVAPTASFNATSLNLGESG